MLLDFVRSLERFAVTSARYKRETNPAAWSFALASVPFASTAEVVSSEAARNSGLAQVRATARLVQSIFLFLEVPTSRAPSNTTPLTCNRYCSSNVLPIHHLISFLRVRVIMIMWRNYYLVLSPGNSTSR